MAFFYPNLLGLLESGRLKLNPNCLLTRHSEGPGPFPTTIDGLKEAMQVSTRPRATIHSLHHLKYLTKHGKFTYVCEEFDGKDVEESIDEAARNLEKLRFDAPSADRKTANGGYKTRERTKKRIGDANKGNVPHNKGKPRSTADKKAISGGVNLRVERIIVLGLLVVGGLTRDEYKLLIRKIKTLRQYLTRKPESKEKQKEFDESIALRDRIKEAGEAAYHDEESSSR